MAKIPVYSPQVQSGGLPGVRQTSSAPRVVQVGAEQAQQTMQLGQVVSKAGEQMARIQIDMQEEANRLRVDDALNKAKEAAMRYTYDPEKGYLNIKGEAALNRESGKPLSDEYFEILDKDLQGIADGLGNDRQRALFNQARANLGSSFREQLMRHETGEYKSYRASVREGTIANRTNEIGLSYNNPALIAENIGSIKAAVWDIGQLQGWSAEKVEAEQRKATSVAHRTALAAALQKDDVGYASAYLERNAKDMDADDILRVKGLIQTDIEAKVGMSAVQNALNKALPQFAPTDIDRISNLSIGDITQQDWFKELDASKVKAESGGRRFKEDGTMLEGPYVAGQGTAKGDHQVMDATNAKPGFTVTPARDSSPEERARVGRDYMAAMVREYKGDLPKALAAYNAGPGNVNNAIKKAQDANDAANWMNFLPKPQETIPYVNKILADFSSGKGKPNPPTLFDFQREALASLDPNASAKQRNSVMDMAKKQYEAITSSIKAREDSLVADAMRELQTNGGNFEALPLQLRAAIPPDKVDDLKKYGMDVNKVETNPATYQRLSDPAYLMSLTDNEFFALQTKLSNSDWQQFAKQRGGKASESEKLNTAAIDRVLKNALAERGINPNPKADTDDYRRLGVIRSIIDKSLLGEQARAQKQLSDVEVEDKISQLWMKSVELKKAWSWSDKKEPKNLLSLDADEIPDEDRDAIIASYKNKGLPKPDDYEILRVYMAGQLSRGAN